MRKACYEAVGKELTFIPFKDERLQHFFYHCGHLEHVNQDCEMSDGENHNEPHLRASPVIKHNQKTRCKAGWGQASDLSTMGSQVMKDRDVRQEVQGDNREPQDPGKRREHTD